MAEYCTIDDLATLALARQAFKGMPDPDIRLVIGAVSAEMDTYLAGGEIALPLESWGLAITECAAAMAAWRLVKTRGYNPQDPAHEGLRLDYEDKIAWLKMVASGQVIPDVVSEPDEQADADAAAALGAARVVSSPQRGWYDNMVDTGPFSGGNTRR